MTDEHKQIIQRNFEALLNLNASAIMPGLVAEGIITFDEMEDINANRTKKDRSTALLQLLVTKQDLAFSVLVNVLKAKGSPELAEILRTQ